MNYPATPTRPIVRFGLAALLLATFTFQATATTPDADRESQAKTSAVRCMKWWLSLVDKQAYPDTYNAAATFFKRSITREEWVDACEKVREPFGKLEQRKLLTSSYLNTLSDGTKGPFVISQFRADFKNQSSAIETVTFQLDDGKWKASGYYLRPVP